jgi:poly(3-hydroxybutyrate) depolymerase
MKSNHVMKTGLMAGLVLGCASMPVVAQRGGAFGPVDPRAEQRTYVLEDTGEELPYALFVSSKVTGDEPSPLIVALHGLGGSQDTFVRETYGAVELAEEGGYILVTPMGYNSAGWYGIPADGGGRGGGQGEGAVTDPARVRELSEADVMNVLGMIREEFNINDNRIYLMGHSMGGAGALHLGVKHAPIWAALAPIAPAAMSLDPNSLASIQNMPVILVVGDEDNLVEGARRWAAKLDELGMTHEYHELAGGDHMSVIADGMPDIFDFFANHSKATQ